MVRIGRMALRSHLLAAVAFVPYATSEIAYAANLWPSVPRDSLTIIDRGFLSARILLSLTRDGTNRHWLIRTKKSQRWRVLRRLGPRDAIVEMNISSEARRKEPGLPKVWVARAITYQRKGFRAQTLLTSLLDPDVVLADEIATLYHERWELELGYDEIRSKSPTAVTQELWSVFLAYNLVRLEMQRVATSSHLCRSSRQLARRYLGLCT